MPSDFESGTKKTIDISIKAEKMTADIAKVYGVTLNDAQVKGLLNGKSAFYTSNGKKTIVHPEIVENPYNGKVYYQWKTERGK